MEYPRAGVEADSWVREMWRRAEAGRPSHKRVLNLLVESEFFADFLKVRVAVSDSALYSRVNFVPGHVPSKQSP